MFKQDVYDVCIMKHAVKITVKIFKYRFEQENINPDVNPPTDYYFRVSVSRLTPGLDIFPPLYEAKTFDVIS